LVDKDYAMRGIEAGGGELKGLEAAKQGFAS